MGIGLICGFVSMLDSLRVRNFRSFSDSEKNNYVNIRPLTVLLGKNSSGKSSFLRTFPLLRQSVETDTTGPILWYGSYVDFGAFSEVKNNSTKSDEIYFDFKASINQQKLINYKTRRVTSLNHDYSEKHTEYIKLNVELCVSEENKKTVAKSVKIVLDGECFLFNFHNNNKCELNIDNENIVFNYLPGHSLLPPLGKFIERKYQFKGKETIYTELI